MTVFNDALWFDGDTAANGTQLFKLGNDGSVTKWTSIGIGLEPIDMTIFNNALWFNGLAGPGQFQLFKLGNEDGSVTKWTADPGGGGLTAARFDPFSTVHYGLMVRLLPPKAISCSNWETTVA